MQGDGTSAEVDLFNEALKLAEIYIIARKNRSFANEDEVLEFFATGGWSLQEKKDKKCMTELNASQAEKTSVCDSPHERAEEAQFVSNSAKCTSTSQVQMTPPSSEDENNTIDGRLVSEITAVVKSATSIIEHRKKEALVKCFNDKNQDIVSFIVDGKCDAYLLNIISAKSSER